MKSGKVVRTAEVYAMGEIAGDDGATYWFHPGAVTDSAVLRVGDAVRYTVVDEVGTPNRAKNLKVRPAQAPTPA
jgi:hypothetical protein